MPSPHPPVDPRFRIERLLGRGGFGAVFLATELASGELFAAGDLPGDDLRDDPDHPAPDPSPPLPLREVALKLLDPTRVDLRRFGAEVRALCRLAHPAIVPIHAWGTEPSPWLAMELVAGGTLASAPLPASPIDVLRTVRLLREVADAVAHAHARGVVHRDLTPQNVLVDSAGHPRVVDFGLAFFVRPDRTATQRVGTPGYLAPELIEGDPTLPDHRVDLYSLGATIHAAFAGRPPFDATSVLGILRDQAAGRFALDPRLPALLRPLVERCLAVEPIERPLSAAEVADELERVAGAMGACSDAFAPSLPERIDVRDAVVTGVRPFSHPTRGDGVQFFVVGGRWSLGADHAERVGAFVYRGRPGSREDGMADVLLGLRDGAEVSLWGAHLARKADGVAAIALLSDTRLVVEPYFLVPVTTVARVDGLRGPPCPTRALVDARALRTWSGPIVAGSILHQVLEDLARHAVDIADPAAFDVLFDRALAAVRLEALAAGMDDAAIDTQRTALRPHFEHLARWTEPTAETRRGAIGEAVRYSARHGLDGRIDLLVRDGATLRVIELKSGRREMAEHTVQLQSYAMMLDETARRENLTVEPILLYSSTGRARTLRPGDPATESRILHARNVLLGARRFVRGAGGAAPPAPGEDLVRCGDDPCRFRRATCEKQAARLGHPAGCGEAIERIDPAAWRGVQPALAVAARRHFFHFAALVEQEYAAATAELGRTLRADGLPQRIEALDAFGPARLASVDAARRRARFEVDHRGALAPGDALIAHRGEVDVGSIFRGTVDGVDEGGVTLLTDAAEGLVDEAPDGFYLDRDVSRGSIEDMQRGLYAFLDEADPEALAFVIDPASAAPPVAEHRAAEDDAPAPRFESPFELNAAQARAVEACLGRERFVLIKGPPGTGKTSVIAAAAAALRARGERVLIAAFTNTAVDTALARVVGAGVAGAVRVGSSSRATLDLQAALAEAGIDRAAFFTVDAARAATSQRELHAFAEQAALVGATANACISNAFFAGMRHVRGASTGPLFDVAIIDEASQLVEPLALGVARLARRVVLVGDECQLPPVVSAAGSLSALVRPGAESLVRAGVAGLDRSLFERLRPFAPTVLLTTQYRMHPQVQDFPSRCFYGGALEADAAAAARRFPVSPERLDGLTAELRRRLDPARPSVWVEAPGLARRNVHAGEVEAIVETAAAMLACLGEGGLRDAIGVVSPYRAQCHAIRTALRARLGADAARIEVDTVDRFQGREKEAILISLVASSWNDFVMDPRRLNVMFTRARTKVVVFGSRALGRRMLEVFAPA